MIAGTPINGASSPVTITFVDPDELGDPNDLLDMQALERADRDE